MPDFTATYEVDDGYAGEPTGCPTPVAPTSPGLHLGEEEIKAEDRGSTATTPFSRIITADARSLPLASCTVDLVVTSPPGEMPSGPASASAAAPS